MKKELKGFFLIVFSGLLAGGAFIFPAILRNFGVAPITQSIIRNLFASSIVFLVAYIFNKKILKIHIKQIPLFLLIGFFVAAGNLASFSAIFFKTPVAIVAFLFQMQPIITIIFSRIILKELVKKKIILGALLGLFGVYFLCSGNFSYFEKISIIGIVLSILASVFFAGELIFSKKAGNEEINPFATFSMSYFSAAIINLFLSPILNRLLPTQMEFSFYISPQAYLILLLAAIHAIIFISMFYIGIRYIKASVAGIILLLQPISATLLGLLFLKESISYQVILGGGLILLSVIMVTKDMNNTKAKKI